MCYVTHFCWGCLLIKSARLSLHYQERQLWTRISDILGWCLAQWLLPVVLSVFCGGALFPLNPKLSVHRGLWSSTYHPLRCVGAVVLSCFMPGIGNLHHSLPLSTDCFIVLIFPFSLSFYYFQFFDCFSYLSDVMPSIFFEFILCFSFYII